MSDVNITGIEELRRNLVKLGQDMPKDVKKALRKAVKPINRDMKRLIPKDSGALRKSVATKIGIARNSGKVFAVVGVRSQFATNARGRVAKKGESFAKLPNLYAKIIEFGGGAYKSRRTSHAAVKFREKTYRRHQVSSITAITREVDLLLQRKNF